MKLKQKIPYNIRKSLFKILPMALLMGAPAMNSCKPEDNLGLGSKPGQSVPHDPDFAMLLWWDWNVNLDNTQAMKARIDKWCLSEGFSGVKIIMDPSLALFFTVVDFHRVRDTLQKWETDIAPKGLWGGGAIIVNPNGAQLPSLEPVMYGMTLEDSLWFAEHGWSIQRYR